MGFTHFWKHYHYQHYPIIKSITNQTGEEGMKQKSRTKKAGFESEKRDSNPRPRPWQGRALPTELFSHNFNVTAFVLNGAKIKTFKYNFQIFFKKNRPAL